MRGFYLISPDGANAIFNAHTNATANADLHQDVGVGKPAQRICTFCSSLLFVNCELRIEN